VRLYSAEQAEDANAAVDRLWVSGNDEFEAVDALVNWMHFVCMCFIFFIQQSGRNIMPV